MGNGVPSGVFKCYKTCKKFKDTYGDDMCISMFSATVTDMIYDQINDVIPVKRLGQEMIRRFTIL